METGISENDLANIARRGIAVENNPDIFFDDIKHRPAGNSLELVVGETEPSTMDSLIAPMSQIFVEFVIDTVDKRLPTRLDDVMRDADSSPSLLAVTRLN